MGTGSARLANRATDTHAKRRTHHDKRGAGPRLNKNNSTQTENRVLGRNLPKAGMVYPYPGTLMRRKKVDVALVTAMKKGFELPSITKEHVHSLFSGIFEKAAKLLRQSDNKKFKNAPVRFLEALHKKRGLREVWPKRRKDMFFTVFLTLRAARQNWHKNPRDPFNIEDHCQLARTIDVFLEVDKFNWGSRDVIHAFRHGRLNIIKTTAGRKQAKKNQEQDTSDPTNEALQEDATGNSDPSRPLKRFVERMRRLNIELDKAEWLDIVAELRINNPKQASALDGQPVDRSADENPVVPLVPLMAQCKITSSLGA